MPASPWRSTPARVVPESTTFTSNALSTASAGRATSNRCTKALGTLSTCHTADGTANAHLRQRFPERHLVLVEVLEERHRRGVRLPAREDAFRTVRRELLIDEPRHALVRARPLRVAAAEHGEAHVLEGRRIRLGGEGFQPRDEVRGVVGGLAWRDGRN